MVCQSGLVLWAEGRISIVRERFAGMGVQPVYLASGLMVIGTVDAVRKLLSRCASEHLFVGLERSVECFRSGFDGHSQSTTPPIQRTDWINWASGLLWFESLVGSLLHLVRVSGRRMLTFWYAFLDLVLLRLELGAALVPESAFLFIKRLKQPHGRSRHMRVSV